MSIYLPQVRLYVIDVTIDTRFNYIWTFLNPNIIFGRQAVRTLSRVIDDFIMPLCSTF